MKEVQLIVNAHGASVLIAGQRKGHSFMVSDQKTSTCLVELLSVALEWMNQQIAIEDKTGKLLMGRTCVASLTSQDVRKVLQELTSTSL